jgi:hypothetical protein
MGAALVLAGTTPKEIAASTGSGSLHPSDHARPAADAPGCHRPHGAAGCDHAHRGSADGWAVLSRPSGPLVAIRAQTGSDWQNEGEIERIRSIPSDSAPSWGAFRKIARTMLGAQRHTGKRPAYPKRLGLARGARLRRGCCAPLLALQRKCAARRFASLCPPPHARGITWSTLFAPGPPQIQQTCWSRSRMRSLSACQPVTLRTVIVLASQPGREIAKWLLGGHPDS